MATPPTFTSGAVLTAAQMNSVGLWLVKTQDVGNVAVTSVTVTGAFNADYQNYLVLMSGGTLTDNTSMFVQLGASTTGYYAFLNYGDIAAGTPLGANRNNGVRFAWVGGGKATFASHASFQLVNPFGAVYTKLLNGSYQNDGGYGSTFGEHRVATSYTSFVLGPESGTMTGGTIRVYGYRN